MTGKQQHAIVIGAGVSGYSCAIALLDAGWQVSIWAKAFSPHTTSDRAAAIWYPYCVEPWDRVASWARLSLELFSRMAERPGSGVSWVMGHEYFQGPEKPWWHDMLSFFKPLPPEELPPEYPNGYCFAVPLIEMPRYMPWLDQWFHSLGGTLVQRELHSLEQATTQADLVVNCSGLGARQLCRDDEVFPIRGQVVWVKAPQVQQFYLDETGPHSLAYIIPRRDVCVLGGTLETGNWNEEPDPASAEAIRQRCAALVPSLAQALIVAHHVGLRPGRDRVRLELEKRPKIIHNYGHGGAGVTLSWGCASEVVALAAEL